MSTPLLEVRSLGVPFGDPPPIQDASWDLADGERIAVSGRSGSGKSVMLRALVGLLPATGTIRLSGQLTTELSAASFRVRVLHVPQTPPRLSGTIRDNLLAVRNLAAATERACPWEEVEEMLERLGIQSLLDAPAERISGGEAQRMGLVRALQLRPQVLLLDEPTAALDPESATAVESLVLDWVAKSTPAKPRAFLWVAHDTAQAQRIGTRFLEIRDGRCFVEQARA